tara:strand:- start:2705 stop:2836 length:132 start_codon:yes stop_codon:yes gene_type:complete
MNIFNVLQSLIVIGILMPLLYGAWLVFDDAEKRFQDRNKKVEK